MKSNRLERLSKENFTGRPEPGDGPLLATHLGAPLKLGIPAAGNGSLLDGFLRKPINELGDKLFFSDLSNQKKTLPSLLPEGQDGFLKFRKGVNLLKIFSTIRFEEKELCGGVSENWLTVSRGAGDHSSSPLFKTPWHYHPDGDDHFSWTDWVTFISMGLESSLLLTQKKLVLYRNQQPQGHLKGKGFNISMAILGKQLENCYGLDDPYQYSDEFLMKHFRVERQDYALP